MEHKPVESSNVRSLAYDAEKKILQVKFHNGTTGNYSDVPQHKFDALLGAKSVGSHLHRHIKGVHGYEKVDDKE